MTSADVPVDSITELLAGLVRTSSRALQDPKAPVLERLEAWFASHGLVCRRIMAGHEALALHAEVQGEGPAPAGRRAPSWLLNATLDTAGFGDPATWSHPPTGAAVVEGWLYGRGAADSKAGVALFAHLLAEFSRRRSQFCGRLAVLFDLDEHSGHFGGARAFFDAADAPRPDGVLIGYAGNERIMVGARGFERARVVVHGVAAHSGASSLRGLNAALRGAALAQALQSLPLAAAANEAFDRPAQLTLTGLHAGDGGFAQVPDRCELALDLRLTPRFDAPAARALVQRCVAEHDAGYPAELASELHWQAGWPAYRVPDDHAMVVALRVAAAREWGRSLPCAVAGPSNIGNYLASLSVPALCGFGVRGEGVHAADERVEMASIAPAYRIYRQALQRLLAG